MARASGVGTFVRHVDDELKALGVDSRIVSAWDEEAAKTSRLPSVLHIHGLWTPLQHRAAAWACRNGVPVVWSTHGMTAPWALRHKRWKKRLAWLLFQRRDLRSAALVHCTTELEADWNRKLGFARICVVPLGTTMPAPAAETGIASAASARRVLLYVGRIYPVKAIDRLIEAFARAIGGTPTEATWTLRIVGPDQNGHLAELTALCDRLGLPYAMPSRTGLSGGGCVEFAGPKYDAELAAEYAKCTALALVSHTENFGATVVDALAHGKPVVTSTRTPWKVVADRGCGLWVDNDVGTLAESLKGLFSASAAELADMGRRGRQLVEERYTWPAVGKAMLTAYAFLAPAVQLRGGRCEVPVSVTEE